MAMSLFLVTLILIALAFEFINGFHDTANVVATPIATRSLSPYQAIVLSPQFLILLVHISVPGLLKPLPVACLILVLLLILYWQQHYYLRSAGI